MSDLETAPLLLARCPNCHGRFLPRPGPCPRCGSAGMVPHPVEPVGTVRAATSLEAPAAGWPSPHRLALVEVAESVHLLAVIDGELPSVGQEVVIRRDGEVYRASRVASA
ncbi:MAG: Zn-ribbon domain-containing OB-fold protein [Thermoplasmata archaeon]